MQILFNEQSRTFHLTNDKISYIMTVLPNGHLSHHLLQGRRPVGRYAGAGGPSPQRSRQQRVRLPVRRGTGAVRMV